MQSAGSGGQEDGAQDAADKKKGQNRQQKEKKTASLPAASGSGRSHGLWAKEEGSGRASVLHSRKAVIPLPHNSVVVMMSDAQESWRHAIPRMADGSIRRHPAAGLCRISLTFRMTRAEVARHTPHCNCGNSAALKSSGPAGYYYMCDPTQPGSCSFIQRARWAEKEAIATRIVELAASLPDRGVAAADVVQQMVVDSAAAAADNVWRAEDDRTSSTGCGDYAGDALATVMEQGKKLWDQGLIEVIVVPTNPLTSPGGTAGGSSDPVTLAAAGGSASASAVRVVDPTTITMVELGDGECVRFRPLRKR